MNAYLKIEKCSFDDYQNSNKNPNTIYFIMDLGKVFIGTQEYGKQGVSGVYVGSGDIPEGYNIQINPEATDSTGVLKVKDNNGTVFTINAIKGESFYESAIRNNVILPEDISEEELLTQLINDTSDLVMLHFKSWEDIQSYTFSSMNLYYILFDMMNNNKLLLCEYDDDNKQLLGRYINDISSYYKINLLESNFNFTKIDLIDSELSETSSNPVYNSIITSALNEKSEKGANFLILDSLNNKILNPYILLYQNEDSEIDENIKIPCKTLINSVIETDTELSVISTAPISNQTVTQEFDKINKKFNEDGSLKNNITVIEKIFYEPQELIEENFDFNTIYQITIPNQSNLGSMLNNFNDELKNEHYLLISYQNYNTYNHFLLINQYSNKIFRVNLETIIDPENNTEQFQVHSINSLIDSELSLLSENPISNKAVTNEIKNIGHKYLSFSTEEEFYNYQYEYNIKYFICLNDNKLAGEDGFEEEYIEAFIYDNQKLFAKGLKHNIKYYVVDLNKKTIIPTYSSSKEIQFLGTLNKIEELNLTKFQKDHLYIFSLKEEFPIYNPKLEGIFLGFIEYIDETLSYLAFLSFDTGERWKFNFDSKQFYQYKNIINIDDDFSDLSENPLQNKIITNKFTELNLKLDKMKKGIEMEDVVTQKKYSLFVENGSLKLRYERGEDNI